MEHYTLTPKFPHLLHGGDYNPDQWLDRPDILQKDIELFHKAHINCVSLGIFAWAKLEPREGFYDFDWMAKIIDDLYANGIYTVLATPSGARPVWMSEKYPETRRVNNTLQRDLTGGRHNHCPSSPIYRRKVQQMNTALARRFAGHPGVILWHISNEYGGECFCPLCIDRFRGWLRKKYGTLDALNHAWWTGFWSRTYTDWNQITPPVPHGENCVHGLTLDWKRFTTWNTVDFMQAEIDAVKAVNPALPCTANLMGFYDGLDYFKFGEALDVVSWDSYPLWHSKSDVEVGAETAAAHDLMRSIKHEPWLLMESTPSMTNWQQASKLKRPGMHMLSSMQAVAHGSQSVQYFQLRKSRGSFEKLHGAVIDHYGDGDTRVFSDVTEVGARLQAIDSIYKTAVKSRVAIVFDWENRWAIDAARGPRNCGEHYVETVKEYHRVFWELGIPVDFVNMDGTLDGYDLVVAPMLYMYRNGFAEKMKNFVSGGGTLVGTYQSGIADGTDLCFLGGWPGDGMMDVFGVWNEEVDALYDGEKNVLCTGSYAPLAKDYTVSELCALIHTRGAKVLGTYGKDFYQGCPALTVNDFGKGKAYYLAAKPEIRFLFDFFGELSRSLSLPRALSCPLPYGVIASLRQGQDPAQDVIFVQNFNDSAQQVELPQTFTLLETGETVQQLNLPPYGVAVLRRG